VNLDSPFSTWIPHGVIGFIGVCLESGMGVWWDVENLRCLHVSIVWVWVLVFSFLLHFG
jgi:hypothetical protein